MDPYKVLQVDPEAEDEVIQAAYRRLAQKYHPDVAGPDGATRMTSINAAWELLRDPARRAAHDRARSVAEGAPSSSAQAPPQGAHRSPPQGAHRSPPQSSTPSGAAAPRPAENLSRDWTSGRSGAGSGYDPSRMRSPDGRGAAGPPPGNPSGAILAFGRYDGWSLGEIARSDVDYIEWLDRMPIGRPYRDEIDVLLRKAGRRRSAPSSERDQHGLFRRR
jgi:curved DNA-binding protein CbpA